MVLNTLTSIINQLLSEPYAGLLSGIVFGTKATLSDSLHDSLIQTGTLHVVALSGMNISILVSLVNLTLLRVISRRWASLLTIVVITGYICITGLSPSVLRAATMGIIGLLAVAFGRQTWSLLCLMLAVGIMLLLNPLFIADLSFQLSALATLGIILFGKNSRGQNLRIAEVANENLDSSSVLSRNMITPSIQANSLANESEQNFVRSPQSVQVFCTYLNYFNKSFLRYIWRFIEDDLRITLAAQVFTIPLILFTFHRVSLVSPLTNVLIGFTMAPIMVIGLVLVAVGLVWLPLARIIAWFVWVPLAYDVWIIELTSKIPFASLGW